MTKGSCSAECHQQSLDRNKNGYCGLGGTGISCPVRGAKIREVEYV
jgi:hypothetical protein